MDQVTQQNAALVEEAAAAAESMKDQAGSLKQAVSVFVTNDTKLSLAAKAMPAAARRAA
jgi:methyl-accepting chemotaxis protein